MLTKIYQNLVQEQSIDGDGKCYFRNLSYFYVNNQEYHAFFRNILFQYISNNQTDILNEFPQIEVKDKLISTINFLPKIAIESNYAGFFEIG